MILFLILGKSQRCASFVTDLSFVFYFIKVRDYMLKGSHTPVKLMCHGRLIFLELSLLYCIMKTVSFVNVFLLQY